MNEGRVYFQVTLSSGIKIKFPSDSGASYSIDEAGVLTITTPHGTQHYSPSGWWAIDARPVIGDPEK